MKLAAFVFFLGVFVSCDRNDKPTANGEPYPPLEEQRESLASKARVTPVRLLDSIQLINDLEYLASDITAGRKPGTAGHEAALQRIVLRFGETGLDSLNNSIRQVFTGKVIDGSNIGVNLIGVVHGTSSPDKYVVVTAHYDHLGQTAGGTFYGADDNGSGTACLLALAKYFKQHPQSYSLIFVALDREETGLEGAYAAAGNLSNVLGQEKIKLNINMDMIARSDQGELFVAGVVHYPSLVYVVNETQSKTNVKVLMGHDGGTPGDDWTMQSDHAAFHARNIPFLYLGVEDHADYHKMSDTVDKINYSSYIENCNLVASMILTLRP